MDHLTEPRTDQDPAAGEVQHASIRRTFEEELQSAKDDVLRLGALVEAQLQRAGQALTGA